MSPYMPAPASIGLLFVRIVVGIAFVLHGLPKIEHPTNWMHGHGLTIPGSGLTFGVPSWLQAAVAAVEFFGGFALVFGVLTRLAGVLLFGDMLVAFVFSELPRHVAWVGGGHTLEPNLTYLAVSFLLLLAGPGAFSIDATVITAARRKRVHRRNVPFAA